MAETPAYCSAWGMIPEDERGIRERVRLYAKLPRAFLRSMFATEERMYGTEIAIELFMRTASVAFDKPVVDMFNDYAMPREVVRDLLVDVDGAEDFQRLKKMVRESLCQRLDSAQEASRPLAQRFLNEVDNVFFIDGATVEELKRLLRQEPATEPGTWDVDATDQLFLDSFMA